MRILLINYSSNPKIAIFSNFLAFFTSFMNKITLLHVDHLFLLKGIRYHMGACVRQDLFKLLWSKGVNLAQKWPKMAKNRENSMLFKMHSEENGKSNPKSDLIFGFTMKFYITYPSGFLTLLTFHA